ncbi:cation channel sperm-associated auxiliary subunit epsilon-like [Heteronotia binoei]|uniref:cation channel sperm-associated auxiliary subunit epsilon-like n=1 Tax=Heteronotia binoei TaxID=13085 RepID=UPI00292D6509|nr:cation channel sperm-associated auxiliary subunit epsilon-like [Heteronotia binoei]
MQCLSVGDLDSHQYNLFGGRKVILAEMLNDDGIHRPNARFAERLKLLTHIEPKSLSEDDSLKKALQLDTSQDHVDFRDLCQLIQFILAQEGLSLVASSDVLYDLDSTDIGTICLNLLFLSSSSPWEKNSEVLSEFIIWTEDTIFLGRHGNLFFQIADTIILKNLLGLQSNADIALINACYDSRVPEISILIACTGCSSSRMFFLAVYDEDGLWFLKNFYLPAPTGRTLDMIVVNSAVSSMLLWDNDKVYYSYKGNRVNGYIKVSGSDSLLSAASEGTTIQQIIIDHGENTIIKMKNNVMYFFKFTMKDVIKLHAWESESKNCILYVNPHGGFYLLTVNGSNIHRQVYPLRTEVLSATQTSQEACPYISFQHSMKSNVYYVDMGNNVTFWTQIVFLENLGLFTEVTIHKSDLLKQKTYLNYEIARGICTKNKTITLYHDQDYSQAFSYKDALSKSTGIMTVEVQPSSTGRQCIASPKISHIYVGCPPKKRVLVLKQVAQKRTLLKTPKTCLSQRERPSLLGLVRRLEAETRSLLDSRACRFCRISELAIAAAMATPTARAGPGHSSRPLAGGGVAPPRLSIGAGSRSPRPGLPPPAPRRLPASLLCASVRREGSAARRADWEISYNKKLYGCPIEWFYEKPFRPTVALYENRTFVQFVESEYVLLEVNGRTDFLYNATMAQFGSTVQVEK